MRPWPTASLAELGTWYGGGTPSKSRPEFWDAGTIPWVSPKDMRAETLSGSQNHVTEAAVEGSAVRLVPPGSVAMVVRSGILERTIPVAVVPFAATFNQDIKALAPHPEVDPRWVAWGLRAAERELLATTRKAGTTVASINTAQLLEHRVPIPAIREQQRAIEILEAHLSQLDAAQATLKAAIRRELLFEDAIVMRGLGVLGHRSRGVQNLVNGELPVLPVGWEWKTLGRIADVVGGVTKDAKKQANPGGVEVPYLRVANVQRGCLALDRVTTIRVSRAQASALALQPGDVLMNEGGDRDKLARGWVWEGQIRDCIHQNHVFRARPGPDVHPEWLAWCANSYGSRWAQRHGRQSVNLASISLKTIRSMPIPVPTLDQQRARLRVIRDDVASGRRMAVQAKSAIGRGQSLRRAVLAAAFSGRLTGASSDIERIEELAEAMA